MLDPLQLRAPIRKPARPCRLTSPQDIDGLQKPWIGHGATRDTSELAQLMWFSGGGGQNVKNRDTANQESVRQQPPVTPPPHRLGAHDDCRGGFGQANQRLDRGAELRCLHVIRVATESFLTPCGVGRLGPRSPATAELWAMPIGNSVKSEECVERVFPEMRVPSRMRNAAHVRELPYAVRHEKVGKLVGRTR